MDEGASYLGECALVPYNSPIQNSGLLFYNTLFDENAACHLALGMGFADTIKNFENYTLDECRAKGINDSMVHEDFIDRLRRPVHRRAHARRPYRAHLPRRQLGILMGISEYIRAFLSPEHKSCCSDSAAAAFLFR